MTTLIHVSAPLQELQHEKRYILLGFSKNTIFYHYMRLRFMEKKTHMPGTCSDNKNNIFLYKMKPGSMFALISMSYSMKKATFCSDFVKNTIFVFIHASDYG